MTDDLRHAPDIERGVHAEKILKDQVFIDAWEKVRQAYLTQIENSPSRDTEGREYLFKKLQALRDARAVLEQVMQNGKLALHLREEESRLAKLNPFRRKA